MLVRPISELKATQSRMLAAYKTERQAGAVEVDSDRDAEDVNADMAVGRVDEVVTIDVVLGPHLKVALQRFSGLPPSATDASTTTQVYYPSPGRSVGDFVAGEHIGLMVTSGVRLAFKL